MENAQKTLDELIATREDVKIKVEVHTHTLKKSAGGDKVNEPLDLLELVKSPLVAITSQRKVFLVAVNIQEEF